MAGGGVAAAGLMIEKFQQEQFLAVKVVCLVLAGLIAAAGVLTRSGADAHSAQQISEADGPIWTAGLGCCAGSWADAPPWVRS